MTARPFCAIDFGTSNSAVAVPDGPAMRLIELEPGFETMPTAVFYPGESVGRGQDAGGAVRVRPRRDRRVCRRHRRPPDAVDEEHPRQLARDADHRRRRRARRPLHRHRRDLPAPPARAGRRCARRRRRARRPRPAGVLRRRRSGPRCPGRSGAPRRRRQRRVPRDRLPVRADRGRLRPRAGGRRRRDRPRRRHRRRDLGLLARPRRAGARREIDRRGDILAAHGVHLAGTDFDRRVELASVLPLLGYGAYGPSVDGATARARCRARCTSISRPGT